MKTNRINKDLLNGNISEQILILTMPIFGSHVLQQVYQFVDSIVLGRYAGVEAMAAVGGSSTMLINILVNAIGGIAAGIMIVVAQNLGRGNNEKVKDTVKTGMFIAVVFGAIVSVISILLSKPLLLLMNCPEEILKESLTYMYAYFIGIVPYTIFTFCIYILRAKGESKIFLFFTIVIAIIKIILDVILNAIFNLGVLGVGISTFVSYLVCGILALIIFNQTTESHHFSLKEFGFDLETLIQIFKIGFPVAIQSAVFAITNAIVSMKINEFGTNTIAAFSAYNNVDNLYWSFTNAIGAAVVTITGQNYGNKNIKRVKDILKYGIIIHAIASIVMGVLEFIFGVYIFKLFTTNSDVINIATKMIKLISVSYVTYVLVEMISSSIKGCGDSVNSMIIAIIGICVVRISYLLLCRFENPYQVLYCYPISWSATSIIYLIYYLKNSKKYLSKSN